MRRSPNVGSMLCERLRRWADIEPALGERLVFAGNVNQNICTSRICSAHFASQSFRLTRRLNMIIEVISALRVNPYTAKHTGGQKRGYRHIC